MTEMSRGPIARFRRSRPAVVDVLVAVAWILLTLPSVALVGIGAPIPVPLLGLLVAGVVAVAVILATLRRRRAVLAYALIFVVTLPLVVVDPSVSNLAGAFAVYAVAVHASVRRAWQVAGISAGYVLLVSAFYAVFGGPDWFDAGIGTLATSLTFIVTGLLTLLVGVLWGQIAAGRRRYIDDLIEHARHLEHERDQQVQLAVLAERSRMSRDVHDIVAHSLSVIVRLADGAQAVFDTDPAGARSAVGQVGTVARSSLTEMRRVIGVLESAPSTAATTTAGFADLEGLAEVYRGVGMPVELTLSVTSEPPAGVQMTVYRVVQEALTNALRHAASPSRVTVTVEAADAVTVEVRNDGALAAPSPDHVGRGIVGMRERAAVYDGELSAGPDEHGAWRVRLVLPKAGS